MQAALGFELGVVAHLGEQLGLLQDVSALVSGLVSELSRLGVPKDPANKLYTLLGLVHASPSQLSLLRTGI